MAYTENKRIDGLTLAGRSALMKLVCQVNGETDAKYILIENIYELINNLAEKTTSFQPTTDELRIYDSTEAEERKIQINDFFANYVRGDIYSVPLYYSATLYATLVLRKQLDAVSGILLISPSLVTNLTPGQDMETSGGVALELPTEFEPYTTGTAISGDGCNFISESPDTISGTETNHLALYYNGTNWRIWLSIDNLNAAFKARSFSVNYLANNDSVYSV